MLIQEKEANNNWEINEFHKVLAEYENLITIFSEDSANEILSIAELSLMRDYQNWNFEIGWGLRFMQQKIEKTLYDKLKEFPNFLRSINIKYFSTKKSFGFPKQAFICIGNRRIWSLPSFTLIKLFFKSYWKNFRDRSNKKAIRPWVFSNPKVFIIFKGYHSLVLFYLKLFIKNIRELPAINLLAWFTIFPTTLLFFCTYLQGIFYYVRGFYRRYLNLFPYTDTLAFPLKLGGVWQARYFGFALIINLLIMFFMTKLVFDILWIKLHTFENIVVADDIISYVKLNINTLDLLFGKNGDLEFGCYDDFLNIDYFEVWEKKFDFNYQNRSLRLQAIVARSSGSSTSF